MHVQLYDEYNCIRVFVLANLSIMKFDVDTILLLLMYPYPRGTEILWDEGK